MPQQVARRRVTGCRTAHDARRSTRRERLVFDEGGTEQTVLETVRIEEIGGTKDERTHDDSAP